MLGQCVNSYRSVSGNLQDISIPTTTHNSAKRVPACYNGSLSAGIVGSKVVEQSGWTASDKRDTAGIWLRSNSNGICLWRRS